MNKPRSTVICYGQTGAGKTYTISGVAQAYPDRGIIPRALAQLFEEINQLKRHEATVRIVPATHHYVVPTAQFKPAGIETTHESPSCFQGELNRTVGTHVLNRVSSRAHTIFTVYLTVRSIADGSQTCLRTSRINFVDLAGSERVQKTKISTLRFASRVMRIPCHPAVQEHEDIKMLIKRLRDENILLKQELLMYDTL
ncbi:kinesin motor domain protein, partial [Opisthorchis viverrini]